MSLLAGLFVNEYMAYAAASAYNAATLSRVRGESFEAYMARNASAMSNGEMTASAIAGIRKALVPTVHERDREFRRRLGIPGIAEDIQ